EESIGYQGRPYRGGVQRRPAEEQDQPQLQPAVEGANLGVGVGPAVVQLHQPAEQVRAGEEREGVAGRDGGHHRLEPVAGPRSGPATGSMPPRGQQLSRAISGAYSPGSRSPLRQRSGRTNLPRQSPRLLSRAMISQVSMPR